MARALALLSATVASVLVTAWPAQAKLNDGETPSHLGWAPTVLIYVIAPLGGFLLIGLLCYLPSLRHRPRYRPALAWDYDAVWFNGPDNPDHALTSVGAGQMKGGGASASW
jgi:hypothetical protein